MTPSKSRRRRRRRKRKNRQRQLERLRARLEQGPFRGEKLVIVESSGQVKMSEVLSDFVEPYLDLADTEEAYRKLLTLAVVAWNVSFLPEDEQQDMIDQVIGAGVPTGDDELKSGLKWFVNMLIARKRAYFPGYTRRIIDFELTDTGEAYHLAVASTIEEEEPS